MTVILKCIFFSDEPKMNTHNNKENILNFFYLARIDIAFTYFHSQYLRSCLLKKDFSNEIFL